MFSSKDIFFGSQASGYRVSNSLRFRSSASAYLSRTPASAGNRKTWTWSAWIKRGTLGTSQYLLTIGSSYTDTGFMGISFAVDSATNSDCLNLTTGTQVIRRSTNQLRDPSAWYHCLIAFDTTQSTASNRAKMYVNGTQVTVFQISNDPALNTDYGINQALTTYLGRNSVTADTYFDGYIAEQYFIDGQALTPSSFGAFDTNGIWQPARYTGSYGTNGFYLPFSASVTSTYAGSFSTNKTITTPTTNTLYAFSGDFTVEGWINPSALSGYQGIIAYSTSSGWSGWQFTTNGANLFFEFLTGSAGVGTVTTSSSPLTANVWQHVAAVRSGSTITIYVNGVSQASGTYASVQNSSTSYVGIGSDRTKNSAYFGGSISNIRVVNGTAVYTANFVPSSNPLTAITNTQLLTLQNSSIVDNSANAQTLTNNNTVTTSAATPWSNYIAGVDSSGLNNNWASANVNVTSSGTTYDSMIDSPTNYADGGNGRGNYATLSPIINGTTGLSNANLTQTAATEAFSTILIPTSGKWYWEQICQQTRFVGGLSSNTTVITGATTGSHVASGRYLFDVETGGAPTYSSNGGSFTTFGSTQTFSAGSVLGYAYDADNQKLWVSLNGTWLQGSPSSGTSPVMTPPSNGYFVIGSVPQTGYYDYHINFGQQPFNSTPPSGFSALNTQNLPTPTIAAGNKYFDVNTYTGDGTNGRVISGLNLTPDLFWTKARSAAYSHAISDTVRGVGFALHSDTTAAEDSSYGLAGAGTNSYTINGVNQLNASSTTYVAWLWKGGNGTSNIAVNAYGSTPSIASTVSANTSAGFSVVTYTGTGANATVGHGLGVAPSMIIVKCRSTTSDWAVYHKSTTAAGVLWLNLTNAYGAYSAAWNSTEPTSTVFSVGTATATNASSSSTHVAYCFAPVAGYSAFGSYTGNGSADGPFVYCGFRPRYVLMKRTDTTGDWQINDTGRNGYNQADARLWADISNAETANGAAALDFLSNGFKFRSTASPDSNASGGTYIYAAFAENPLKFARAR